MSRGADFVILTGEQIRITFLAHIHHTIASLPHPYQSLLSFQYFFWLTRTSFHAIISDWRGFPVFSTKVKQYVKMRQARFLFVISAVVSNINKTPKHKLNVFKTVVFLTVKIIKSTGHLSRISYITLTNITINFNFFRYLWNMI